MIKTKLEHHQFNEEDFLNKLGLDDGDVLLVEAVRLEVSHALNGAEFREILVELRCSNTTARDAE